MSDLRERVAMVIYEAKRMRLLEAFGDTGGWPKWEALKPTLKEIQMEECDPYIAIIRNETLEEAARVASEFPAYSHGNLAANPYAAAQQASDEIAAAIRALKDKP